MMISAPILPMNLTDWVPIVPVHFIILAQTTLSFSVFRPIVNTSSDAHSSEIDSLTAVPLVRLPSWRATPKPL